MTSRVVWVAGLLSAAAGVWVACGNGDEPGGGTPPSGEVIGEETQVEGSRTYSFDDGGSLIYVQVFAVPGTAGHDHVMRATGYTGTLVWDSADPSTCSLSVELDVEKIAVDEDEMRDLVGYDSHLSDTARSSVRNNMLAEDQLNSAAFPTMTFVATSCTATSVTGDLTLHGVTKSVSVAMEPTLTTEGLFASGTLDITHTQFGIQPYQLLNYENADGIKMTMSLKGVPVE